MKYTLAENAISSLNIAIEHFKRFYYASENEQESLIDEYKKICIVFLENSIELMLKTILATEDPLSIYENPESKKIQEALSKATYTQKLEDILISSGNFKTIKYIDAVNKYNDYYHNSEKVYNILKDLGDTRNIITHFGIDNTNDYHETTILIFNTFDIIYNYLYPELIKLDNIGHFFTSDGIFVDTIHGPKFLFDENNVYNNIVDFLDEILIEAKDSICCWRAENPKYKIKEFTILFKQVINDKKFIDLLSRNNYMINIDDCDYECNNYSFTIMKSEDEWCKVFSNYSAYYNSTCFCGESGETFFVIVHDKSELYIYDQKDFVFYPEFNEPEIDNKWLSDLQNGFCKKTTLSKRNLISAMINILDIK